MLIRPKTLSATVRQLDQRNWLTTRLHNLNKTETHSFYKYVLSVWLGSNISYHKIETEKFTYDTLRCVKLGYYCFLTLDKNLSTLPPSSTASEVLEKCFQGLLTFYNNNFLLLTKNPVEFLSQFKAIIEKIEVKDKSLNDVIQKTKQICLQQFDTPFVTDEILSPSPDKLSKIERIKTFLHRAITCAQLYPFYPNPISTDEHYDIRKMILPARDGVLLDGLLVKTKRHESNLIVLALVGHFQTEHSYLDKSFVPFQNIFNNDIVFLNHRNYSIRAKLGAKSAHELANDVVDFAKYFRTMKKDIVLYGMCGGSAHMILAAKTLHKQNIPFKLIVDRFATKYSNFFEFKTLKRVQLWTELHRRIPPLFKTIGTVALFLWIILVVIFVRLLLLVTGTNINFGNVLRSLPEGDVLTLQAKSKKRPDDQDPEFTDLVIDPNNDIRHFIKGNRHVKRTLLKKLNHDCQQLADIFEDHENLCHIFSQLANCFKKCLELIDNEKLTLSASTGAKVNDLHAKKLWELHTRHGVPMKNFLHGFFSKPRKTCEEVVALIPTYSTSELLAGLNRIFEDAENSKTATLLVGFLNDLKQHQSYISYMGDRLHATGLGSMRSCLQQLIASVLFQKVAPFAFKNQ